MTDEQYLETQRRLMRLAVEIEGLDLDGFIARIEEAGVAGPALNPTLFRRGAASLSAVKELAGAGRLMQALYLANAQQLLPAVLDAYTEEERAQAGIV